MCAKADAVLICGKFWDTQYWFIHEYVCTGYPSTLAEPGTLPVGAVGQGQPDAEQTEH